ncbi:hypothetical protein C1X89_11280 [Pseudomonas sp. GP01-A8]|nr:hypothetical protein C1X90_10545 [Pseudomonas sp. GP01-A9]PMU29723.1 hypothetical protein C1X88_12290 [Pseudomonas sp. GP01-A13]PMU40830.1 hypothetical protein C1X89_11280 [Pseudomonas sp. GP01-A8]PMU54203.1 hypothetical protein C1X85_13515 [Pseudomonas sp. GP01-A6]PMU60101.1 hypothetical protein C1X86_25200 [Pseudomonas sp. GP01-A3]PMU75261.1 hypothetical protein C1X81_11035 [Pseudomonas sp. FW215-L2]PMU75698.1 hypothetical protein C1X84_13035 [Pseudomonas sp. GP01-A1]PMU82834.1 hypothet
MSNNIKARGIQVIDLSHMGNQADILHPEFLALKLSHRVSPFDIGVCAYTVRGRIDKLTGGYSVNPDSLINSRKNLIVALLDGYYVRGLTHKSIETDFKYVDYGIAWCDANGHSDVYCNPEAARVSYLDYTNYLFQEVLKPAGMAPLTGQQRQQALKRTLQLQFPNDYEYIVAGVSRIKARKEGLEPPEDDDVKKYIDIVLNIALTFSRFLVGVAPFPMQFETKEYRTHFFPGNGRYITPYSEVEYGFSAYNYRDGRLLTLEELRQAKPKTRLPDHRETLDRAQKLIDSCNADSHHPFRMKIAAFAMRAFACLINLVVGANSGEVIKFLYDDAIELVKSPLKKELTATKLRAKGLKVTYPIGRGPGMQLLREYLKFRDWILDGCECEYLFFNVLDRSGRSSAEFVPLESRFSTKFYNQLQGVFVPEDSKNIPPQLVRKFKSLTLQHLKHSPLLVSAVMNHSERTNAQSYSGITKTNQKAEFANYWAAVKKAAERVKNSDHKGVTPIAVGHCDEMNNPSKDIPVVAIEPDCKTQYGCLFCIHYVVHSDETDIQKLMSFQYVIEVIRENAPNFEYSEETFKDVAIRIDAILDAISERSDASADLVKIMRKKVFDLGKLTPFWESRLQRYEKMGIYI